ncbi:glycosyltransferase [Acidiphilium acidophilum]|uniref:Glycosyltransferase n=1 Tax=Acidiphilium acidophilum TaxID=76588 RepID=A0AAW9DLU6_ACIAO|nr:glycosyltransferase [Acidiphilium acidophilum]MDX5929618.1 glycosyltransferase [Acidiphilium acidophilum]
MTFRCFRKPSYSAKLVCIRSHPLCQRQGIISEAYRKGLFQSFLSTVSSSIAQKHTKNGFVSTERNVKCMTLATIFKKYSKPDIHFLKIDVEGHEEQVVCGNIWDLYRPWVLVIEATEPTTQIESYSAWENVLLDANYRFVYSDGLNRYYLAHERQELAAAFKAPPNTFDGFITYQHFKAEDRAAQAEDRAAQAEDRAAQAEDRAAQAEDRAAQAEDRAAQAEDRAAQAEDRATRIGYSNRRLEEYSRQQEERSHISLSQLSSAQQQINNALALSEMMTKSLSWRLTSPLRHFNPQHQIAPFIKRAFRQSNAQERNLQQAGATDSVPVTPNAIPSQYIPVQIGNLEVSYESAALCDRRGIGRVSHAILNHLERAGTLSSLDNSGSLSSVGHRKVFFFSTVHWAPEPLPQPSVLMIHDIIPLLFPEIFPDEIVADWRGRFLRIAEQASCIVTISDSSAADISRHLRVSKDKIRVIYNGVTSFSETIKPKTPIPSSHYIVYLGSYDHHKNLDVVLKAMLRPELSHISLALIGENSASDPIVKEFGLSSRVYFFGHIPDGQIGYILKNALALVFPSIYEGFGLPPLEAALLGTPSICSRRPAMTEVLKDAALFADPHRPEEWSAHIANLAEDAKFRKDLSIKAQARAETFTWDATIKRLVKILQDVSIPS